jgi:ABC-type multidrug transport system permease subunit
MLDLNKTRGTIANAVAPITGTASGALGSGLLVQYLPQPTHLVYLVLLGVGGVIFSLDKFPAGARPVLRLLPTGALSDGLHQVLQHGAGLPVKDLIVLLVWAVLGIGVTTRVFRWE